MTEPIVDLGIPKATDGFITIIGVGSLLSETSARTTCPRLKNFRKARVDGFRRIFNKVGIVFIERGLSNFEDLTLGSCATEPFSGHHLLVTAFEIPGSDIPALVEREHRFRFLQVPFLDAFGHSGVGVICAVYSDYEYRTERCGDEAEYEQRVGQYYNGALWRTDIKPCTAYLRFCLKAAAALGQDYYDNFLEHGFLADGLTPLRHYLAELDSHECDSPGFDRYRLK